MRTMDKSTATDGMTPLQIKFLVYEKWGTITACAGVLKCSRIRLSYCIGRKRLSADLRWKLALELEIPVEELFGDLWDSRL